jgi:hypothetical protein
MFQSSYGDLVSGKTSSPLWWKELQLKRFSPLAGNLLVESRRTSRKNPGTGSRRVSVPLWGRGLGKLEETSSQPCYSRVSIPLRGRGLGKVVWQYGLPVTQCFHPLAGKRFKKGTTSNRNVLPCKVSIPLRGGGLGKWVTGSSRTNRCDVSIPLRGIGLGKLKEALAQRKYLSVSIPLRGRG